MSERTSKATTAVRKAWRNERQLVSEGRGTRDWTQKQQRDILDPKIRAAFDENNEVYRGHHMQSVELFPQYQGDPENIQFLSKEEHLKAHDGSFRILTNWYYNPETKKKEVFEDDKYKPCKIIYLSDPICPPKPIVDESNEIIGEEEENSKKSQEEENKQSSNNVSPEETKSKQPQQDQTSKMESDRANVSMVSVRSCKNTNGVKTDQGSNSNTNGQPVTLAKQIPPIEKRESKNDSKATKRFEGKPHDVKQPEKKGRLALLVNAIRDKHRELLRREFYDEYGDYYDDPVEKFEAMRAHVDQHEGDSIISCFLHVLRYGKRTYVDPVLENPMVQNAISQAVSLRVQRKLSEGLSRNESTNADEANITRQGCTDNHGLSSSKDAISPNVQKPDVQEPTTTGAKVPSSQLTLDTINKESFMKEAGYSTHVPTEERHRILDDLRAEYTEKEIEDRLNFNVNLKKNSSKDYSNAIEVWQKDLDYLHSGDTED